jgi:hypothetical protein
MLFIGLTDAIETKADRRLRNGVVRQSRGFKIDFDAHKEVIMVYLEAVTGFQTNLPVHRVHLT